MTNTEARKTVVVAGAGYAGVLAANRIAGKLAGRARVILVSAGEHLVDRIRLHEAAARGARVTHKLDGLLHRTIERIDAHVVALDPKRRALTIERGGRREELTYDELLLTMGSRMATQLAAHDARHAFALSDMQAAHALAQALPSLAPGSRVAVVGGGLTAIELSSEIAEAHPKLQVELITTELTATLAGQARAALERALQHAGVTLRLGQRVTALQADAVQLEDGSRIPAAVSVLAAGFVPTPLPVAMQLPQDANGRVVVDEQLRVVGLDHVFAAGDLAAPPASCIGTGVASTRMACATALPLGAHAADQIVRQLEAKPLEPFRMSYVGQCISIGRRQGVFVAVDADDRPTGTVITGRAAAFVKELICRLVLASFRLERLFPGLYAWAGRTGSRLPQLPSITAKHVPS